MALSVIYVAFGNVGARRGAVLRPEGGGARDRARGGGPHRQARARRTARWSRSRPPPSSRIFFFDVPFPLIVLAAGARRASSATRRGCGALSARAHGAASGRTACRDACSATTRRRMRGPISARSLRIAAHLARRSGSCPVAAVLALCGSGQRVRRRSRVFFSKMAVVTFGGAYAVLAYVAQQAVRELRLAAARRDARRARAWRRRRRAR